MPKATNDQSIYEVPNDQSDGSAFDLPDTDDSGETDPDGDSLENAGGEGYDIRGQDWAGVKVVNGYDENVDVDLKGTTFDDSEMAEDVDDTTGETVNAGENGFLPFSERWAYVRIEVTPAAGPTAGTLKVVFQSDKSGA